MKMRAAALMCLAVGVPVSAQVPEPAPSLVVPVQAVARTMSASELPANTEIWVAANTEVNSKKIKQGEKFDMSVSRDVVLGDYIVVPRGTRAVGQISYRTGKGAFGKSAKMEFEVVEIDLRGRSIPVKGHYRIEGQGNTGATVGAAVAVGVFAVFVTGRSAIIAQGVEYRAYTTSVLPISTAPATIVASPAQAPTAPVAASAPVSPAAPLPGAVLTPVSAAQASPKTR